MRQSTQQAGRSAARRLSAALLLGAAVGAVGIALPAPVAAQESQASLRGTITPAGGAQQITAVQVATNTRRTVEVSPSGSYNFPSLRPGLYRLEIVTPNGIEQTDEFDLLVAQNAVLDFDLAELAAPPAPDPGDEAIAGVSGDTILVTGARIRSLEGAEVGDVVTRREIELLPQGNRNFLAFADTAPGVQFVTEGGGNTRLQGGGQNARSVNVFIDGVSQKDFVLRGGITGQDTSPGNPFPQLAIGEYRVIGSNYKAEFDQVSSVAITAITRSGTNEFEGEGFYDFTNQDLRSATPSEERGDGKAESEDKQFGGAIGGPIIPDTLFFFASYEGKRIDSPYSVFPGAGLTPGALPPQYQDLFGTETDGLRADLLFYKLDFLPTDRDLFQLSVKYRDETSENGNDGTTAAERLSVTEVEDLRGLFRWEHTEDTWINDFRLSYEDASWAPSPQSFGNGSIFELGTQGQIVAFGGGPGFQDKGQEGWTIQNDFTWVGTENHTVKGGIKLKFVTLNTLQLNFFNPQYNYNVLFDPANPPVPGAPVVPGLPANGIFNDSIPYRLQFGANTGLGEPTVSSDNFQFGIYIQDDWEVNDRLTLNLGIRWDYEETPAYLDYVHDPRVVAAVQPGNYPNLIGANYDINNFISTGDNREPFKGAIQPRIGFSYFIDEDGRFILYGGYGRSYDRNQFDFLQQEIIQGTFSTRTFRFQNAGDPAGECTRSATCVPFNPIFLTEAGRQQLLAGTPGGTGGFELRFIDNDLKVPYSDQFSIGLRGQFDLWETEIGYRRIQSRDGFAYLLGNRRPGGLFFPPNAPPNSPFGNPPPGFGAILIGTNGLETNENIAHIKVDKRYTDFSPWNLTATYTYIDAEENRSFGETFSLDFPSLDDYPFVRSSGVSRHRLVTTGAVDMFWDLTLSGRVVLRSNPFIKSLLTPQTAPFERMVVGTVGEGDWLYQVDLALTKFVGLPFLTDDARLRFRIDVLNVFDRANYTNYNGNPNDNTRTPGSPTIFGERVGFGTGGNPPRTLKLTAGFSF